MKSPPIPISALVARIRASRRYAAERRIRLSLTALQKRYTAGEAVSSAHIGFVTMTLWAAMAVHEEAKARYQQVLEHREAMPADKRWSVKELEQWLQSTYTRNPAFATGLLPA